MLCNGMPCGHNWIGRLQVVMGRSTLIMGFVDSAATDQMHLHWRDSQKEAKSTVASRHSSPAIEANPHKALALVAASPGSGGSVYLG